MKLILVANSAGGVGKTTTALACAVAATEYGKKVLLIDADPRASLTFCCGVENPRVTTKEFLQKEFNLDAAVMKTSERFSLLSASSRLSALDAEKLLSVQEFKVQCQEYDLVIVDSASNFDLLIGYFASVADLILVPTNIEILGIRGALQAKDFVTNSDVRLKPELLFTRFEGDVPEEIIASCGEDFSILEPAIRNGKEVPESQMVGKSFLTLANNSAVAADYREITYTLLEKIELI